MRTVIVIYICCITLYACSATRAKTPVDPYTEIWTVASQTVNCSGVALQRCLLIKPDGAADWELFYSGISGFDYEPGFEYVIAVHREYVDNPPMDASSVRYKLIEIISKAMKDSDGIPDTGHIQR
ncbi:MAG: DUF4377 domain-containing protein [Alistipes sp.]|nr:DUF4377 domain-containing protein [Alistipes sp.]